MADKRKPRLRTRGKKVGTDGAALTTARPCATLADLRDEDIAWLWHQRVSFGDVTLLAGPGEQGKSTIATAIAAALTLGGQLPGGPFLDPAAVLWYGPEERAHGIIKPRMRANGAILQRVYVPDYAVDGKLRARPRLPRDIGVVHELARSVGAKLIVFDPITSYCEDGSNPDHGSVARSILQALADLAHELLCAVVVIKHPKKYNPGQTPLEQVSGAKEWTNMPRSVLLLGPHPDNPGESCMVSTKGSIRGHAPTLTYRLIFRDDCPVPEWGIEIDVTAEQLFDGTGSPADRDALLDAKMLIADRLSGGEQRAKDMARWAEENCIPAHVLRKAKKALGVLSKPVGNNEARHHVWMPPKGGFPAPGA